MSPAAAALRTNMNKFSPHSSHLRVRGCPMEAERDQSRDSGETMMACVYLRLHLPAPRIGQTPDCLPPIKCCPCAPLPFRILRAKCPDNAKLLRGVHRELPFSTNPQGKAPLAPTLFFIYVCMHVLKRGAKGLQPLGLCVSGN